jgi:hypothetical protein
VAFLLPFSCCWVSDLYVVAWHQLVSHATVVLPSNTLCHRVFYLGHFIGRSFQSYLNGVVMNQVGISLDNEEKKRKREELMRNLDDAIKLASELRLVASKTFGHSEFEAIKTDGLTVDEKIALGNDAAAALYNIAFSIHPERTLDHQEDLLGSDIESLDATRNVVSNIGKH